MSKKNIDIKIKYSLDFETQRVLDTLRKIEWYAENNYKVVLPSGFSLEKPETITRGYIKKSIAKEYRKENYERFVSKIKNERNSIKEMLPNGLFKMSLEPQLIYFVFLTKYGVGGSYCLPNTIIINISIKEGKDIIETIIHEIIHLSIEPFISKFRIDHWQKERIVDLIFLKIFPKLAKFQKIPKEINVEKIDRAFNQFSPDIEKIIRNIKILSRQSEIKKNRDR